MTASYTRIKGGVCAPRKFQTNAVSCGIKNPDSDKLDLALIYSEVPCVSAGTFTTNRIKAAPVRVTQNHMRANSLRAILANSGNANCCTGVIGIENTRTSVSAVAKKLNLKRGEVGVCSTGVIGLPMPMARIDPNITPLVDGLSSKNGDKVAEAIMTSDTCKKEIAISFDLDGHRVRIGACAKGAGMISPSMATMLCFITTDVNISEDNCKIFRSALEYVMLEMAKALVSDGERVTKFVTVNVKGARTYLDAKKVAEAVAKSALVKSSWNGNDPNWGRIIHAVGYSRARIKEDLIDIYMNGKPACLNGLQADTPMDTLCNIVSKDAFDITIDLNLGQADYTIYSSDLSPEYIDFNRSEYAYWKQARKDGLV